MNPTRYYNVHFNTNIETNSISLILEIFIENSKQIIAVIFNADKIDNSSRIIY